jgi:hypothetical protein
MKIQFFTDVYVDLKRNHRQSLAEIKGWNLLAYGYFYTLDLLELLHKIS